MLQAGCDCFYLLFVLDGTGTGDHGESTGADAGDADIHPGVLGMKVPGGQLEGLYYMDDFFHAGQLIELQLGDIAVIAGDADDGFQHTTAEMGYVPQRFDFFQGLLNLVFRGVSLEY